MFDRHYANLLTVYSLLRNLGIPAAHIIVLNSGVFSYDPRNPIKGDIIGYQVKNGSIPDLLQALLLAKGAY